MNGPALWTAARRSALEQAQAERVCQRLDVSADRWLAQVELLGGPRDAAFACYGHEGLEPSDVHSTD
jgi:hypothetical protein